MKKQLNNTKIEKLISTLVEKKANENNTIDLNTYALGLRAMYKSLNKFYDWQDIKTFKDAAEVEDVKCIEKNNIVTFYKNDEIYLTVSSDRKDIIAEEKLKIIVKTINQDWQEDWNDINQKKWYLFFQMFGRFGFSYSGFFCDYTHSFGGARLCLESKEKAEFVGKTFEDLYKDMLV